MDQLYDANLESTDIKQGFVIGLVTNPDAMTMGQSRCVLVVMRQFDNSIRITKRRSPINPTAFFVVEVFGDYDDLPHSNAGSFWHPLSDGIIDAADAVRFAEDREGIEREINERKIRFRHPTTKMHCSECDKDSELNEPFIIADAEIECSNCGRRAKARDFVLPEYY